MRKLVLAFLFLTLAAGAHVGSPDVFFEGSAGPYKLFVTIRPPIVIPGVAEIEIRSAAGDLGTLRITPLPLTGLGAKLAPMPDVAQRSKLDPQFYTGSLWLMRAGSWQVRVQADGARGPGELSVPVPALPNRTLGMQLGLGAGLFALMLLLALGAVSIVGAGAREGQLEPGATPGPPQRRKARVLMAVTAALIVLVLYLGNNWWKSEANNYARFVYKPLKLKGQLESGHRLVLRIENPGWMGPKATEDFVPDHNHLMHMYVIRLPEMERVWHLHPDLVASGVFAHDLPSLPAGRYQLYADIVHRNGLQETMVAEIDLPEVDGKPLAGDDAGGAGPPLGKAGTIAQLSDGSRMIWERDAAPIKAKQPHYFRFRVEDRDGKPAQDLELYMGMQGHAAFVKTDRTVFAHVHPSGSVPMASLALTRPVSHTGHEMHAGLPPEVAFPYGFPKPGDYRIFVQIKRAGRVETGMFDARVE